MDIITGNLNEKRQLEHGNWVVGHFIAEGSPFRTENFEVKWINRKKGVIKKGALAKRQASTLVILIQGKMMIRFPGSKNKALLKEQGDFVYYDANQTLHESETLEDTVAIVLRWPSFPDSFT